MPEEASISSQVLQRGIAIDRLRILYVPVPKAGCTALLWSLAGLARVDEKRFATSRGREVTRALTIHDLSRWPESFRFGERSTEDRDRILSADDWLRFSVVRHPFRRLWSAWQSKVLLAEPQFIERYSSEPWFPGPVHSGADLVTAFRQFMTAFAKDSGLARADVHWGPQVDVIEYGQISYDHVGRVEDLGETLERVRDHIRSMKGAELRDPPRTNVMPLPYADELFTEADIRFLSDVYADDMRAFGYEAPSVEAVGGDVPASWTAMADAVAPALVELRQRNERVHDLNLLVRTGNRDLREAKRRIKREERLRREEHRRNERLQKRLRNTALNLQRMRTSASWRYTAPLRKVGRTLRRVGGALRGEG